MGGVAQGIGQALMEHQVYDRDSGQLLTGSFMDYAMPRAACMPNVECVARRGAVQDQSARRQGHRRVRHHRRAADRHQRDDRRAARRSASTQIDMPATPLRVWQAIRKRGGARRAAQACCARAASVARPWAKRPRRAPARDSKRALRLSTCRRSRRQGRMFTHVNRARSWSGSDPCVECVSMTSAAVPLARRAAAANPRPVILGSGTAGVVRAAGGGLARRLLGGAAFAADHGGWLLAVSVEARRAPAPSWRGIRRWTVCRGRGRSPPAW